MNLDRIRERVENGPPLRWWWLLGALLLLALFALIRASDGTAVGRGYFEAAAQVLPVIFVAFIIEEAAILRLAADGFRRMEGVLNEAAGLVADDRKRSEMVAREREHFDRAAAQLPQKMLEAPMDMMNALVIFACGEAMSLFVLADERYATTLAIYVAISLFLVIMTFANSLRAHIQLVGIRGHIELTDSAHD